MRKCRLMCEKWYVLSCLIIQNFATGFTLGLPAVLTSVLTTKDSDIYVTKEEASWITSAYAITGPIGCLIIPIVMQMHGRRLTNIFLNSFMLTGTIVIATASDLPSLIAGRAIQGIAFCKIVLSSIIIAEYSHPKRRGTCINLKGAAIYLGITACHGLSAVLNWRQIAWLSSAPSVFGLLAFTWPETPYWLAYKGRFDDCRKAFTWLRGNKSEDQRELKELISAHQNLKQYNPSNLSFVAISKTFSSKEFLNQFGIIATIIVIRHACGTYFLFAYIIEIMTDITGDKSRGLYFSVVSDFVKSFAIIASIGLERMFKRKTLLIVSSLLSCFLLALMCLFDYLNKIGVMNVTWLPASLLVLYCFFVNAGLIPLIVILISEVFSIEFKGVGLSAAGIFNSLVAFLSLKITSNMLATLKTNGTFAVYLLIILSFSILLYFIMPETKDKTLQNIENVFFKVDLSDQAEDLKESKDNTVINPLISPNILSIKT